jgi:hypothetical protein
VPIEADDLDEEEPVSLPKKLQKFGFKGFRLSVENMM